MPVDKQLKNPAVVDVEPRELNAWLDRGEAVLVDIREPHERAAERIAGTEHVPYSTFQPAAVPNHDPSKRIVLHCRGGVRSFKAAAMMSNVSGAVSYHLKGGIDAWKRSGLPVERSAHALKIDVMRQVQITTGSLVLIGVIPGAFISPWFLILSGIVGGGLLFAGLSGWCGLARLLGAMPWNR